jgi:hypothetical protein
MGQSLNHAFTTDLTICQSCHGSASVNGAAIQSQVQNELAQLASAITTAVPQAVMAADASGGLCVQVTGISDAKCVGGSCKSAQVLTAVPFPVPPSSVWIPQSGIKSVTQSAPDSTSVTIVLLAGQNIPYFDAQTLQQVGTTSNTTKLSVAIYTILPQSASVTQATCVPAAPSAGGGIVGSASTQLFPASSVLPKAIWNYAMLDREGSYGIHNYPWTNAVLQATLTAVGQWQP